MVSLLNRRGICRRWVLRPLSIDSDVLLRVLEDRTKGSWIHIGGTVLCCTNLQVPGNGKFDLLVCSVVRVQL